MKHTLLFIALTLLFLLISCSKQPVQKSPDFIPNIDSKPPVININANNISLNGLKELPGKTIETSKGIQFIKYNGDILRPFSVERELTAAETAEFLGCLALLPLCALAKDRVFPESSSTKYIKYNCIATASFNTEKDELYNVEIINAVDTLPILKISNTTSEPYVISETLMNCDKITNE